LIGLLDHGQHHTEIIDESTDYINKILMFRGPQRTQGAGMKNDPLA
jgi:hypothetical protein